MPLNQAEPRPILAGALYYDDAPRVGDHASSEETDILATGRSLSFGVVTSGSRLGEARRVVTRLRSPLSKYKARLIGERVAGGRRDGVRARRGPQ